MTFTAIIPVLVLCPMLLITLSSLHRCSTHSCFRVVLEGGEDELEDD
jgi:hypothetical protein